MRLDFPHQLPLIPFQCSIFCGMPSRFTIVFPCIINLAQCMCRGTVDRGPLTITKLSDPWFNSILPFVVCIFNIINHQHNFYHLCSNFPCSSQCSDSSSSDKDLDTIACLVVALNTIKISLQTCHSSHGQGGRKGTIHQIITYVSSGLTPFQLQKQNFIGGVCLQSLL